MLKRIVVALPLVLLIALLVAPLARSQQAAKPADGPTFLGPPAPEELKVLAPLVGKWKVETQYKLDPQDTEGAKSQGQLSGEWVHNGQFLRLEGFAVTENARFEWTEMITYHRGTKQYRRFAFTSEGVAAESAGQWDDKTKTMNWQGVHMPAGWSAEAKTTLDKDRLQFSLRIKNDRGEVTRDASMKAERMK